MALCMPKGVFFYSRFLGVVMPDVCFDLRAARTQSPPDSGFVTVHANLAGFVAMKASGAIEVWGTDGTDANLVSTQCGFRGSVRQLRHYFHFLNHFTCISQLHPAQRAPLVAMLY